MHSLTATDIATLTADIQRITLAISAVMTEITRHTARLTSGLSLAHQLTVLSAAAELCADKANMIKDILFDDPDEPTQPTDTIRSAPDDQKTGPVQTDPA